MINEQELENVRYNISPCDAIEVEAFVKRMDRSVFVPTGEVKANSSSHYDRYLYLCDNTKLAIVYDTTARIVSITGRIDFAQQLLDRFDPKDKTVKRSTVPSQGTMPTKSKTKATAPTRIVNPKIETNTIRSNPAGQSDTVASTRAKLFISPENIRRRERPSAPTVFATSKGALISTDEIFPPQVIKRRDANSDHDKTAEQRPNPAEHAYGGRDSAAHIQPVIAKRPLTPYGESAMRRNGEINTSSVNQVHFNPVIRDSATAQDRTRVKSEQGADGNESAGIAISAGANRTSGALPRRATISFGTDDYGKDDTSGLKINTRVQSFAPVVQPAETEPVKRKRGRPPKAEKLLQQQQPVNTASLPTGGQEVKRKRGRPPKIDKAQNNYVSIDHLEKNSYEYKNGYSVKNYPPKALNGAIERLKEYGKSVSYDGTEFDGTPQEVKSYTVTDSAGQKVLLRYATKRMTLQLQGKRSDLFGEVMSQVSMDSDYSSALENYVEKAGGDSGKKVSDVQNKLKKRLPTAFEFLSEQSRIDFSYGIHDFGQTDLQLSDYSVLLVPAFRGLERFVFDLQLAEGIKVKMIGQAFDKDDTGKYMLKSGYTQRIGSVVYSEVMVALYTEYFSQRNFFAHSDNTGNNISRSIPERARALKIFDHLLDVVEYNARKLKEIGFSMKAAK